MITLASFGRWAELRGATLEKDERLHGTASDDRVSKHSKGKRQRERHTRGSNGDAKKNELCCRQTLGCGR